MSTIRFGFILFLVAVLASVGQVTNTIYVPAMSLIADHLSVKPSSVQLIMAMYLISYGASQFVHGPFSDWFGRRPVVIIGLMIFIVGSALAAFAQSFFCLLLGSFIQGTGIGVGGMMTRTAMRDLYTGLRLHTANSYLSSTLIAAPLVGPIFGGVLSAMWGWRACFVFLTILGIFVLLLEYFFLPETNRYAKQPQTHFKHALSGYKIILANVQFQGYMWCLLITFAGVCVIEAVLGLLFGNVLHFSPTAVSILFVIPLFGYFLGSYFAGWINTKLSLNQIIFVGVVGLTAGAFSMFWTGLQGEINLLAILIPTILFFLGAGIVFPSATTGAIEPFSDSAGKAGALLGGIQNVGSGICALISSIFDQHSQLPLGCILVVLTVMLIGVYFSLITPLASVAEEKN